MPRGVAANYVGLRFGRLRVVALADRDSRHGRYWRCVCDCGKQKDVRSDNLTSGKTQSCGCYLKDVRAGKVDGKKVGRRGSEDIERRFDEDPRYQAMNDF